MRPPSPDASWRDSARPARFFVLDARAAFPVFLALLHIRWWTFTLALAITFFFTILNRYGFTVLVFGRWLRAIFAGKRKMAIPWWV